MASEFLNSTLNSTRNSGLKNRWIQLFFLFTGKLQFYLNTDIGGGTGCYCKPKWNVCVFWPKLYYQLFFFTGKLFYLDTDIGGTGCYCKPEWNVYYWKETNECFEQESPGPCPTGQYFAYNSTSRSTECNCFKNFVYDPTKGM